MALAFVIGLIGAATLATLVTLGRGFAAAILRTTRLGDVERGGVRVTAFNATFRFATARFATVRLATVLFATAVAFPVRGAGRRVRARAETGFFGARPCLTATVRFFPAADLG